MKNRLKSSEKKMIFSADMLQCNPDTSNRFLVTLFAAGNLMLKKAYRTDIDRLYAGSKRSG